MRGSFNMHVLIIRGLYYWPKIYFALNLWRKVVLLAEEIPSLNRMYAIPAINAWAKGTTAQFYQ